MKIIYKTKYILTQEDIINLRTIIAERLGVPINDVMIFCDENFEYSDIIILNENTISK